MRPFPLFPSSSPPPPPFFFKFEPPYPQPTTYPSPSYTHHPPPPSPKSPIPPQLEVHYGQLSPELEAASRLTDLAIAHATRRLAALYEERGEGPLVSQVVLRSPVRGLIFMWWSVDVFVCVCVCLSTSTLEPRDPSTIHNTQPHQPHRAGWGNQSSPDSMLNA